MPTIEIPVHVTFNYLWGSVPFHKEHWGAVNFLIGPNGTGKTLLAEEIQRQAKAHGLSTRYLNAERLSGLERQNYSYFAASQIDQGFQIPHYLTYKSQAAQYGLASSAFVLLKEKLDLRTRIEATLSQLFGRELTLSQETGFLKAMLRRESFDEYDLKRYECHGLKELVCLLTFVYDDEDKCLIIDEPELHLHPQYQAFFLQQVRQLAGDPSSEQGKKCFFIITHSPCFVDVRTVEELRHCIVFHQDAPPAAIGDLDAEDTYRLARFLPRLNTHHKQFFFATRPIFVEGYTDQQLYALIQERRGKYVGAAGACFIDVGGKDDLDLFFRLCKRLNCNAQIIADLDAIVSGKLRQTVAADERCCQYMQREGAKLDGMAAIGEVEGQLDRVRRAFNDAVTTQGTTEGRIQQAVDALQKAEKSEDDVLTKERAVTLTLVMQEPESLKRVCPSLSGRVDFVTGRISKLLEGFKRCGVYVLRRGQLENYLPSYEGNPFWITDKNRTFESEREFLLTNPLSENDIRARYGDMLETLDVVSMAVSLDFDAQVNQHIQDWIYKVQSAFHRRNIVDAEALKKDSRVEWQVYSRLFDLVEYAARKGESFRCRIRLKELVDANQRECEFDHETMPSRFELRRSGEER